MSPDDMRELAEWHEAAADEFKFAAMLNPRADERVLNFAAKMRRDSAAIIRWAADVLEAEPVAHVQLIQHGYHSRQTALKPLICLPVETQLIIKPSFEPKAITFGDDNEN